MRLRSRRLRSATRPLGDAGKSRRSLSSAALHVLTAPPTRCSLRCKVPCISQLEHTILEAESGPGASLRRRLQMAETSCSQSTHPEQPFDPARTERPDVEATNSMSCPLGDTRCPARVAVAACRCAWNWSSQWESGSRWGLHDEPCVASALQTCTLRTDTRICSA